MGRLIDADKLKNALYEDCMTAMGTIDESTLELLMIEIDEIPTAYDVGRVVEQLEEMSGIQFDGQNESYQLDWCICTNKAIGIVKGGGQG